MSERLTSDWTDTSEQAFGKTGAKGDAGEAFLMKVFDKWGWEYNHSPSNKNLQLKGIDISFKDPSWAYFYSADVKSNLNRKGIFYVETDSRGWLFNSSKTSDRIWHVNPDTGWMAWYGRSAMKKYIKDLKLVDCGLIAIEVTDCKNFVTRRQVKDV